MGKIDYQGNLDDLFRDDIEKFIEYNLNDVKIVVALDEKLKFLDLVRGICHKGHVPYEDVFFSHRMYNGGITLILDCTAIVHHPFSQVTNFNIFKETITYQYKFVKEFKLSLFLFLLPKI